MSLEQSVFIDGTIKSFLKKNWGIDSLSYKKLDLGTANCYMLNCEQDTYLLKEYQSEISESQIVIEAEILERLQAQGIPSTYFINTVTNTKYVKYRGHYIVLEKYIKGKTYGYYDFPVLLLPEMAVMLAKIHLALQDMKLPSGFDEEWVKEDAIPKYNKLLELIGEHETDPYYEQIKEDLSYKQLILLKRQDEFRKHFTGLTYQNSHGDYQGCQIICEGDSIKAIIDFTAASRLPVVWELMRSYIQTSSMGRNDCMIDIKGLCQYVSKYCEHAPLTSNDIKSMPYVYVYQVLRSTYGYKEYLLTDSEDRAELISFAFWRTKMCREVLEHAEQIVEELFKIINVK
jgi:Ser/Thr protein kinase RdoA (MazF antagonist)